MDITIKTIRNLVAVNAVVLGLAACSSSPAPWTQQDDSPWGQKRDSETATLPPDDSVTDTMNDPVLLADPEPEPIVMEAPEAAPAPVAIAPVVVEEPAALSNEDKIMNMPGSNYAVQVYASKSLESLDKFKANKGVENLLAVKTDRSGETIYVLVDIYPDRASANAAASELEASIGSKPWVRSVAGLQKVIAQ
jgi:septal ring-binding cell division protein DamX